ncbi:MAG TPA: DUF1801 domain-containing protein [Longimicrobium sp.]
MASSKAETVEQYLQELPEDRRAVVSAVRDQVVRNLPAGYREAMGFGMITWGIPLEDYPDTYNGQPLGYAALAAQKNYYALYVMTPYQDPAQEQWLRDEFAKAGKKLDMGKSCLRFKKLEDLPLDVIGKLIASTPPAEFIAQYEKARADAAAARA